MPVSGLTEVSVSICPFSYGVGLTLASSSSSSASTSLSLFWSVEHLPHRQMKRTSRFSNMVVDELQHKR